METFNAISKVRFASARPQRVHLSKCDSFAVEMLCMEAGQDARVPAGPWAYYVVMGTATITSGKDSQSLAAGQMAATAAEETHTIANQGEGRLVCLAVGPA